MKTTSRSLSDNWDSVSQTKDGITWMELAKVAEQDL